MMRRLRPTNGDAAVNEIIGFVLSFALSAVFLMIAMSSFWTAKGNSDAAITATEVKAVADHIASEVVNVGLVGQEFPNATYETTIALPKDLNGHEFYVDAHPSGVVLTSTSGDFTAFTATTFRLDAVTDLAVWGRAYSSNESLTVRYTINDTGTAGITIQG